MEFMLAASSRTQIARVLIVGSLILGASSCGADVSAPDTDITAVRIDPLAAPFRLGETAQMHAVATNSANAPVAGTITYSSSNPTIMAVSPAGLLRAMHVGSAGISAHVAQVSSSMTASVVAGYPAALTKASGDSGLATVQTTLGVTPSVTVRDSVGNVVEGVLVTFAIASGSGSVTGATATSNASGLAALGSWTLGAEAGVNTLIASAVGPSGVFNTTFTATGVALTPARLAVSSVSAVGIAALPFANPLVVEIRNATGTFVPTATSPVTVTPSGTNRIVGTTTVSAVNGVARFNDLVPLDAGTQTLTFSSPGLVSTTMTVVVAQGAVLSAQPVSFATMRGDYTPEGKLATITNSGVGGVIGGLSVASVTYAATDGAWLNVTLLSTTTQATLLVEPRLSLLLPGTHVAQVTITGTNAVPVTIPVTVVITPLPPASMVLATPLQDGPRGHPLPTQPVIELRDSLGFIALQATDAVSVTIRSGPGYLSGTTTVKAVSGVARFTDLILSTGGTYVLAFSTSSALPVITSRPFEMTNVLGIVFTAYPMSATSGVRLSPMPVVWIEDNNGNPLAGFFLNVEVTLKGLGTAVGTLSGTTQLGNASGIYTFNDLVITGSKGDYLLTAGDFTGIGSTSVVVHVQ